MGSLILAAALAALSGERNTSGASEDGGPLAAASSTHTVSVEPEAVLAAVGDIRLDGPVGRAMLAHGAKAPTAGVLRWLRGDIVFGNLETAVSERGKKAAKEFTFRAQPKNLKILSEAGFTIVSLANNHSMDFGSQALLDALKALDREKIAHIGAGRNLEEARKPVFLEAGGLKIGFLALTSTFPEEHWAGRKRPGVASSETDRVSAWVREAKASCDVLVVSFHGGEQKAETPNEVQRAFGRAAIEGGADIVVGHHPHVLQAVELRGGRPILHSIGNFLFVSPTPCTRLAVIARIRLGRGGVRSIDFVPLDTWTDGRLKPARSPADIQAVRDALDRDGALTARPDFLRVVKDLQEE
ncbi:MAG: CapA family protein [Elusimicrobia bacterium]|nr:CapA family protein [Elusimicrobiota bacterium]